MSISSSILGDQTNLPERSPIQEMLQAGKTELFHNNKDSRHSLVIPQCNPPFGAWFPPFFQQHQPLSRYVSGYRTLWYPYDPDRIHRTVEDAYGVDRAPSWERGITFATGSGCKSKMANGYRLKPTKVCMTEHTTEHGSHVAP